MEIDFGFINMNVYGSGKSDLKSHEYQKWNLHWKKNCLQWN